MNDLELVVELFRLSNHPTFDGDRFSASIEYTTKVRSLFEKILHPAFEGGSIDEIEIDDVPAYDFSDFPDTGNTLSYTFNVTQRSANRFYIDKFDFVKINTLKKGIMPDFFYIVEDDYFSLDDIKPSYINKIENICILIDNLSKLAHFHDIKKDSKGTFYRLVFILHSESKSTSIVLETNIPDDILDADLINIDLLKSLANIDPSSDVHYIEKTNTFRNTIIEYVNKNGDTFSGIIKNWNSICNLYSNNLAAYMSAFSFHKSRKEVVDAEMEYSEKPSKIISEISNKALAIPITLVACIAIFKLSSTLEWVITFIGILITAIISSALIISQKKQLNCISHSKSILFSQLEARIRDDSSDLKTSLKEAIEKLNKNEKFCQNILNTLLSLAWTPTFIGVVGIIIKFKW